MYGGNMSQNIRGLRVREPPNGGHKGGGGDRDRPWFSLIYVKTIIFCFVFCVEKVSSGISKMCP